MIWLSKAPSWDWGVSKFETTKVPLILILPPWIILITEYTSFVYLTLWGWQHYGIAAEEAKKTLDIMSQCRRCHQHQKTPFPSFFCSTLSWRLCWEKSLWEIASSNHMTKHLNIWRSVMFTHPWEHWETCVSWHHQRAKN